MAITLSQQAYRELLQNAEVSAELDSPDSFDGTWCYPSKLGDGYSRWIELRDGLVLAIDNYQPQDQLIIQSLDRIHPIECTFLLAGKRQGDLDDLTPICANQYVLYGSGLAPGAVYEIFSEQPIAWLSIHIAPDLFCQWLGNPVDELSSSIQALLSQPDQPYYTQVGSITAVMQTALQQMLHCPYKGTLKRLYLESKVWELMTLALVQMKDPRSSDRTLIKLKPADIDRIYQAREILLQHFDNPPTLVELAQQIHLNECSLKRGFRQVFGTTVFGYLHNYRLDYARQLLEQGNKTVTGVAHTVGFASRSSFARAFRKKFGINPGQYLQQRRA